MSTRQSVSPFGRQLRARYGYVNVAGRGGGFPSLSAFAIVSAADWMALPSWSTCLASSRIASAGGSGSKMSRMDMTDGPFL
jgi:hypothetical protein